MKFLSLLILAASLASCGVPLKFSAHSTQYGVGATYGTDSGLELAADVDRIFNAK
ncbi:hypothetical protein OAI07_01390 [Akkermansiaceae bacterium]|nr:hypothetical protein [Akkermansiaceae bacterium]